MDFPQLSTERLFLRQFTMNDLPNVYKGLSHPDVIKHYGISFTSEAATKEQLIWYQMLEKSGTGVWWAINGAENHEFYGAAGLNNLSKKHHKAELGFWLLPDYWGKGYIQEAVPPILNYAFHDLKIHRIEAFVENENNNSKKVLEKLNFNYEGTMKDCEIKNGKFITLDIYALLNIA